MDRRRRPDPRELVDPELRPFLEMLPRREIGQATLQELRDAPRGMFPIPETTTCSQMRAVAGSDGAPDVKLAIHRPDPAGENRPCILHIHGGGYIVGGAADLEYMHVQLVQDLGCVIVSVDYRLAPETVFPGSLEDCYAALVWVAANAADLGVDPMRIGVMGESAGGGLAAALALLARDRGEISLAFQHLVYPMLDDRTGAGVEAHPYTGRYVWSAADNRFGWKCLLGREPGGRDVSPYAAPARADDLSGVPPAYISTASLDLFVEENLEYARRLMRVGVPTELHVYPGAFHGFDLLSDGRLAKRALADRKDALARAFDT